MLKIALCKAALMAGDSVSLRVTGISMVPALWPGDSVTVRPALAGDLRLGEVIAFARDGHVIVHRMVGQTMDATNGTLPITQGDTQLHKDLPICPAELLGVVTVIRRFGVDRPILSRRSRLAQQIGFAVGRSRLVRFLLERIYSRVSESILVAKDERVAS